MEKNGTVTRLASIPLCDINPEHGPAYADAKLPRLRGTWGYVCWPCFGLYGGALGMGAGQRLLKPGTDDLEMDVVNDDGATPEAIARELIGPTGQASFIVLAEHGENGWPTILFTGTVHQLAAIQAKSEGSTLGRPRKAVKP